MSLERRLLSISLLFSFIVVVGGVGYALIEGWPWADAFYMAVITVTTVGFGEVHPLTPAGRLFTAVLILLGVGGITYSFSTLINTVVAGELKGALEEHRMMRQINTMQDHYIVCGFGRVGYQVCLELRREARSLVVVDANETSIERAKAQGYPVVAGDAGSDHILQQAGIKRARGLVAAVDSDADNLLVVLTARSLNPELYIVARANLEDTEAKLLRAGADRVISPYTLGGRRLAQMLIRPDLVDFLDVVMHSESLELLLENFTVVQGSVLEGCSIGQVGIREKTGANVLGLIRRQGELIISPEASTVLYRGDVLIALGTRQQLQRLAQLVSEPQSGLSGPQEVG